MSNVFTRSWEITKLTFTVMKKDKKLFVFPLLGGLFSVLFLIAIFWPVLFLGSTLESVNGIGFYGILFILYLGLAFISLFFNTCTVYVVRQRFDGKTTTFGQAIKFAFSKIHYIFVWAIVSAIVGLILRLLEEAAEQIGGLGEIVAKILIGMLGAAWAIMTMFVIPGMVYENIGPFKALKKSVKTVNATWGESLTKYYGLGIMQFIFLLLGVVITIVFAIITSGIPVLMWIIIGLGILYLIAIVMFFAVANAVFNTAIYYYAEKGKIPVGYKEEVMANAFAKKPK